MLVASGRQRRKVTPSGCEISAAAISSWPIEARDLDCRPWADAAALADHPADQLVAVALQRLAGPADDRDPVAERRRGPLALCRGRRLAGTGDRLGVAGAGGAQHIAGRRLGRSRSSSGASTQPSLKIFPRPVAARRAGSTWSSAAARSSRSCCSFHGRGAGRPREPLIRSAAFSAIMIVGAFVLPRVIVGITEASTTRRPVDAVDAQLRVDDRAHRAGRGRVVDGLRGHAR